MCVCVSCSIVFEMKLNASIRSHVNNDEKWINLWLMGDGSQPPDWCFFSWMLNYYDFIMIICMRARSTALRYSLGSALLGLMAFQTDGVWRWYSRRINFRLCRNLNCEYRGAFERQKKSENENNMKSLACARQKSLYRYRVYQFSFFGGL